MRFLIILLFFPLSIFAQSFEGNILYKTTYTSDNPNFPIAMMAKMIGEQNEYFIKGG
ncbi:hypothetical protein [[Flexibacter] sp. ATCC 35208]|uniref:hypothetical protein n=1 Tax=[Flexibacter] sp. ATCC 35208 TaxID=1936242 RepID=UPI0015C2DC50|nr:hypothetical protein [[Flexibacter] sp. ATCC 35208]